MDIKNSIVAIVNDKGKIVGTGFLAGQNLIVTCAHVVEQATAGLNERVTIRFSDNSKTEATVDQPSFSPTYERDVALLRVASLPQGITPLPLGNAAGSAGHDFYAYGYAIVTDVQGIGARGKIVDIVDNGRLVQLASQEPDHGMSGGPVLDEQRRVVIGIVTKGKNQADKTNSLRNIYTTFATSVEVIREVCSAFRLTEICPYRSLEVFNEEDAPFFFGREKVVQKLLDGLKREPRFLAVLGPSGSGKSSVVRAGLIPALRQGKVPGSQKWDIITVRPENNPFEQLAGAGFINPKAGLEISVRTWLSDRPDKTRLMLFIDQFEEALVSTPKDIRQKFIAELVQLLDAPLAITVVLSLRDDFYSRFLHDAAALAGWLERGLVNTPPILEQDDLHAMIFEPAKSIGLTFDEGLVDIIIAEACETGRSKGLAHSTILPLLEFTLTQLWELRKDGRLTLEAYKIIDGTTGSLSQWADRIYYQLNSNERKLAEQIFCHLVHLGNEKEQIPDMRRVIPISELARGREKNNSEQVVGKLVQARLLSVHREYKAGLQYVEIIHDALLVEWGLFREWLFNFRNREQRAKLWQRFLTILGLFIIGSITIFLAIISWTQSRDAISAANDSATAQALAQNSQATAQVETHLRATAESVAVSNSVISKTAQELTTNPELARLFAVEAYNMQDNVESRKSLLTTLEYAPRIKKFLLTGLSENQKITSIVIQPDGKKLAVGSADGKIYLLSFPDGNGKQELSPIHTSQVTALALKDDSMLSGDKEGNIYLWDLSADTPRFRLITRQSKPVDLLAFLNGPKIAFHLAYGDTILWDMDKNQLILKYAIGDYVGIISDDIIGALSWDSRNEPSIYTQLDTYTSSKSQSSFNIHSEHGAISVAYDQKGEIGVIGDCAHPVGASLPCAGGKLSFWNLKQPQEYPDTVQTGDDLVTSVAISPDGKTVAAAAGGTFSDQGGAIQLLDLASKRKIYSPLLGALDEINILVFDPSGRYLVSGGRELIIWDINRQDAFPGRLVENIIFRNDGLAYLTTSCTTSPGEGNCAIQLTQANGEKIADFFSEVCSPFETQKTCEEGTWVNGKKILDYGVYESFYLHHGFSDTGKPWVIEKKNENFALILLDKKNPVVYQAKLPDKPNFSINFPKEIIALQSSRNIVEIRLFDNFHQKKEINISIFEDNPQFVFAPRGDKLLVYDKNKIAIFDVLSGQELSRISFPHRGSVLSVMVNPSNEYLFINQKANETQNDWEPVLETVLDFNNLELINIFDNMNFLAKNYLGGFQPNFSPDGKVVFGYDRQNNQVILLDTFSRVELSRIPLKRDNKYWNFQITSDNQFIIGVWFDRISIWDIKSGQIVGELKSLGEFNFITIHENLLFYGGCEHSRDKLVEKCENGAIGSLFIDPDMWAIQACQSVNRNFTQDEWKNYFSGQDYRITCPQYPAGQ